MNETVRSAKEILDCSIGGFTSLRLEYLKNASRENGSYIPSRWSSNRSYEQLAIEGLVVEGPKSKPGWARHWLITDAGRAHLQGAVGSERTCGEKTPQHPGTSSQTAESAGNRTGGGK